MAVLNDELQKRIDELSELAYEKFQNNQIEDSFLLLKQSWDLYPNPKENWNEAYNTAKYIVDDYFTINNLAGVKEWLNRMIEVNNNLHQSDEELEFYLGKYNFEIGQYQEALVNFKNVVKEAGFRYFEDEDPKYLAFYKEPSKYM